MSHLAKYRVLQEEAKILGFIREQTQAQAEAVASVADVGSSGTAWEYPVLRLLTTMYRVKEELDECMLALRAFEEASQSETQEDALEAVD